MNLGNYKKILREEEKIIKSGGLSINLETKTVVVDGENIKVTATEFGILELLLRNKGKYFQLTKYMKMYGKNQAIMQKIQ